MIVVFRVGSNLFFIYGFAKQDVTNLSEAEFTALRSFAERLLKLSEGEIARLTTYGELIEIQEPDL